MRPSSARVEIQPIGRGATIALKGSCGSFVRSRSRGLVEHGLRPHSGNVGDDLRQRRPRAVLDGRRRFADVNEAGDSLVLGKADRRAEASVVGAPIR